MIDERTGVLESGYACIHGTEDLIFLSGFGQSEQCVWLHVHDRRLSKIAGLSSWVNESEEQV